MPAAAAASSTSALKTWTQTHLQALEVADGGAELLALEEVGHGGVEGALQMTRSGDRQTDR